MIRLPALKQCCDSLSAMATRYACLLATLFCLSGCQPQVRLLPIADHLPQQPILIRAKLSAQQQDILKQQVRIVPLYESVPEPIASYPVKHHANGIIEINAAALPPGAYRALLDTYYQRRIFGFKLGKYTHTTYQTFYVRPRLAPDCFSFDDETQQQMGWTASPVYTGYGDKEIASGNCPGLFYLKQHSWPSPINRHTQGGSLFVPIAQECFPAAKSQVSGAAAWTFELQSPDLSNNPAWQNIKAIKLHLATKNIAVEVQAIVDYLADKQRRNLLSTQDLAWVKQHRAVTGSWNSIQQPLRLPGKAMVTHVRLRFLGTANAVPADEVDSIIIDGICPVK